MTETQLVLLSEMMQQEEEGWDLPITAELKEWVQNYLEGLLWDHHGGSLTQRVAVKLGLKDRNLQRRTQGLAAQRTYSGRGCRRGSMQKGLTSGPVRRPTLGALGSPQPMWELQVQATTGGAWSEKAGRAQADRGPRGGNDSGPASTS